SNILAQERKEVLKKTEELPEVVVTATRTEIEVERAPASVNVVNREKIELKKPKTVDEALNDLPGVMIRRGKGLMDTLSFITLRGIGEQKRTLILMDGMVLNTPYVGNIKIGGYFPEDLEKVEVVKGPFSSLYGGYAMAGVVNFITKMPERREIILKAGYGSSFDRGEAMDDLRRVYFSYGDKLKNLSFFISYGRQETNGYPTDFVTSRTIPRGTIGAKPSYDRFGTPTYIVGDTGDNGWWDDGITIKAQYDFSKETKLRFTFMRNRYEYNYDKPHPYLFNATTGKPIYHPRESSYLPGGGGRIQNTYGVFWETEFYKKLKTKLSISYMNIEKDWYVSVGENATLGGCPPGIRPEGCGYLTNTPQKGLNIDWQFNMPLFSNQFLTFGVFYRWESADVKEKDLINWRDEESTVKLKYQAKGKTQTYALYIQDEIALRPDLTIYLGIRGDFWRTYEGYVNQVGTIGYPRKYPSESKFSLSPKLAIVYKPFEKTVLRGSIGKAFRPPSIYELYRTWTSVRTGITYAGNPGLKPETVISYELGITQDLWRGAKLNLTGFYNKMDDLIYRRTVNATYQDLVNVGKAKSQGLELGFEQNFDLGLKLFANLTYTDSEVLENKAKPTAKGKRLTYLPLWMGNLGLEFKRGKISAYIVGRYRDKWYSDDENRDQKSRVYGSYDEFLVVDARLSYHLTKWAVFSLSFDNIFDKKYYYYYKAPGASWLAELSIKF
ncbi:MAG: TonB-dependent receptor, partial [Thermodesulfobacteriaceae bacterium]|nr:TonB-dependent receptor [Thermodesulfobacteriaceae bacterium]